MPFSLEMVFVFSNIIFENNLRNYYLRMSLYELKRKSKKKRNFPTQHKKNAKSNVFELRYGKMFLILANYSFKMADAMMGFEPTSS